MLFFCLLIGSLFNFSLSAIAQSELSSANLSNALSRYSDNAPFLQTSYTPVTDISVKGIPFRIIQASNRNIYVANLFGYISVVKGDDLIKTIDVGPRSIGITDLIQARDGKIYVAQDRWTKVSVIQNDQVVKTISVGTWPQSIMQARNGKIYVVNNDSANVSVIEKDQVVKTIAVGARPKPIIQAANGKIYVGNTSAASISVIQNDQVVKTIPVGKNPQAIIQAKNGKIYVVNNGSNSVSVIQNDQVTQSIPVESKPMAITQASDTDIYVANYGSGTVSVIRNDRVVETIPVGKYPNAILQASDDRIYVSRGFFRASIEDNGMVSILLPKCPNHTRYDGENCLVSSNIPFDSSYFIAGNYLYLRSQIDCPKDTHNEGRFSDGYHCQTAVKMTLKPKPFIFHRLSDNTYWLLTQPYYW